MAAGIGITPMISILRQALVDAVKTRHLRDITLIAVARNIKERAFYNEINDLIRNSGHHVNVYWCLTQPEKHLKKGVDYDFDERPNENIIHQLIRNPNHDAYVCGPAGFMQSSYDSLRTIGLKDSSIYAEAFGPSSLKRDGDIISHDFSDNAVIEVTDTDGISVIEQRWSKSDGSLLEFLEEHGLSPSYGCRSGQCGSCKAMVTEGDVSHFLPVGVPLEDNEILLCCAKPAKTKGEDLSKLKISLMG
jgi:ferredoxin